MEKLTVSLGNMNLVAEVYDSDYPVKEIVICLEEKESGATIQDIAIVRQATGKSSEEKIEAVECLVYADSNDEDYTNKFVIDFASDYDVI